MAELLSALQGRFSSRQFQARAVADDALEQVLEAGRIAPSAFGMEPWRFIGGEISVRRAAELLDFTVEDLEDLFKSYGFSVPFDV